MPRQPKYGRRDDGTPRNPWKSDADARALGYRSTTDFRIQRGEAQGFTRSQATGHTRKGEPSITLTRKREAALAHARDMFGDHPSYKDESEKHRIDQIDDLDLLTDMAKIDEDEWRRRASHKEPIPNPFWYH